MRVLRRMYEKYMVWKQVRACAHHYLITNLISQNLNGCEVVAQRAFAYLWGRLLCPANIREIKRRSSLLPAKRLYPIRSHILAEYRYYPCAKA